MKRSKLWDIQNHVPERIMQKCNPWTQIYEIKKMLNLSEGLDIDMIGCIIVSGKMLSEQSHFMLLLK